MVIMTTWRSPGSASQQPLVSPNPNGPVPVKSLSSQVMKITELPVHALDFIMALTVPCTQALPVEIRACTFILCGGGLGGRGPTARSLIKTAVGGIRKLVNGAFGLPIRAA